jgi:soluble lytic murein transglycosylase-like protein
MVKQSLLILGFCVATGVIAASREPATVNAAPAPKTERSSFFITPGEARKLQGELASTRGELDMVRAQFERATRIIEYSKRYDIGGGMASSIFDAALSEGIDPDLAFRLVRLESEFNPRAKSSVGAIGLTQLMPSTAVQYQKGVTVADLYNRDTNLRIGFKYLRRLMKLYGGNVEVALVAYNRGEDAVDADRRAGRDPRNGYQRKVMGNYKGLGIVQQGQKR